MAGDGRLAGEFTRDDHKLIMSAAVLCPGVPGVLLAFVEHFQGIGSEWRKTLTDQVCSGHFGKTMRKGLTVTSENTPSVT